MNITASIIRRLPFANIVTHISDDMQMIIALDMADQARREGNSQALPHTVAVKAEDVEMRRRVIEADVFRFLVKYGPCTITALREGIKRDRHKIENALVYMVADGRVRRMNRPTRGGSVPAVFEVNASYAPAEATRTLQGGAQ